MKLVPFLSVAFLIGLGIGRFSKQELLLRDQYTPFVQNHHLKNDNNIVLLPDWRMTTDCSAYSRDCVLRKLNEQSYVKYPFRFAKNYEDRYEWQTTLPEGWKQSLLEHIPSSDTMTKHKSKNSNTGKCARTAYQMSIPDQLDRLLRTLKRNEVNMVSFTISDFSYAKDMMEDVFEMARNVVGFNDAFFMVAMDTPTVELACHYNLPILAWPQENGKQDGGTLKTSVANTKFYISHELTKRRQSFFFFEMDVWFVKSPLLMIRKQTEDILFSGHQNNPEAANIGVFSVLANDASEEYLQICIDILEQSPETHDQAIMQQVGHFLDALRVGKPLRYNSKRFSKPFPELPKFENPARLGRFIPYQIVANILPVPSEDTLAIHPLCEGPLRNPHGKKMIAKELGAWHGSGGYYERKNRYLWLDGHTWGGLSITMSWPGFPSMAFYHGLEQLRWIIAASVALARRTNRIWVMPKILDHYGIYFVWTFLDMASVEALGVKVRETNFPVNPKAWHNTSMPFNDVVRSAVGEDGKIFVQLQNENILAWNLSTLDSGTEATSQFDAWFAIHTIIPELAGAEVLLTGWPVRKSEVDRLRQKNLSQTKLSIAESEIVEVWKKLRWCQFPDKSKDVGRVTADDDCYLRGAHVAS
jgi:hypothetical protein